MIVIHSPRLLLCILSPVLVTLLRSQSLRLWFSISIYLIYIWKIFVICSCSYIFCVFIGIICGFKGLNIWDTFFVEINVMKYVMDVIKFSHDQKKSRISYGYLLNAILASLTFFTKLTFLVRSEYIKMRRVIGLLWRKCHLKTKLFWVVDIDIESFSNQIIYTILKLVFVVKPVDWKWS